MNKDNRKTKKEKTVLPEDLKSGIEYLSGLSMDGVKVHYNQEKPEQLNNRAYEQGTNIHLAPGQEKHIPRETCHVVQQKDGRIKPTKQIKEGTILDDSKELEKEADILGTKINKK